MSLGPVSLRSLEGEVLSSSRCVRKALGIPMWASPLRHPPATRDMEQGRQTGQHPADLATGLPRSFSKGQHWLPKESLSPRGRTPWDMWGAGPNGHWGLRFCSCPCHASIGNGDPKSASDAGPDRGPDFSCCPSQIQWFSRTFPLLWLWSGAGSGREEGAGSAQVPEDGVSGNHRGKNDGRDKGRAARHGRWARLTVSCGPRHPGGQGWHAAGPGC